MSNSDRRQNENALEFLARITPEIHRDVRDLNETMHAHALEDEQRHGVYLRKLAELEKDRDEAKRRIEGLEDIQEVTGVHNTEDLKARYYEEKSNVEKERAIRQRVVFGSLSFVLVTLATIALRKLGLL